MRSYTKPKLSGEKIMNKQICDVIDLIQLVNTKFEFNSLVEYVKAADVLILLGSEKRVNANNFNLYKSLLEQLSSLLLPYFLISNPDMNKNLFSTDMSKMKLEQRKIHAEKRMEFYDASLIDQVKEMLSKEADGITIS